MEATNDEIITIGARTQRNEPLLSLKGAESQFTFFNQLMSQSIKRDRPDLPRKGSTPSTPLARNAVVSLPDKVNFAPEFDLEALNSNSTLEAPP